MMEKQLNVPRGVTLSEILDAREKRAELQKKLLSKYNSTLISFTMNIAGPVKNTPLIDRAFNHGSSLLHDSLPREKVLFECSSSAPEGCESLIAVDLDARTVKDICVSVEESSPLGRLFDMDVIDPSGNKLERRSERSCIVCGKPGRECSAGRLHTAEEVTRVSNRIMTDHFAMLDEKQIGSLATECLIREVETTPKPGLVDLRNCGSHTDMNVTTFIKSAHSLEPYFSECVRIGIDTKSLPPSRTFNALRDSGLKAEATMYEATDGVNTHKGLIYSLGIILGAIGRLWTPEQPIKELADILSEAAELVRESVSVDFNSANGKTAGERLFIEHGIKGIRGEAASGFASVVNYSLPIYEKAIAEGFSHNDAGVLSLISLISAIDDTNLYHRGGVVGAKFAKEYAAQLLKNDFCVCTVEQMDDEFIKRRLSPGGSADLLAITYFLYSIRKQN